MLQSFASSINSLSRESSVKQFIERSAASLSDGMLFLFDELFQRTNITDLKRSRRQQIHHHTVANSYPDFNTIYINKILECNVFCYHPILHFLVQIDWCDESLPKMKLLRTVDRLQKYFRSLNSVDQL